MQRNTSNIKKFFFFVPSLITFMSVICGMWAMYCIFTGQNIMIAVCLIAISACFDAFDGRVARALGVSGNFGVELDSLADFFSFGIAPTFVYFSYLVSSYENEIQNQYIVFALLILFPIAMACRLARFNTTTLDSKEPQAIQDFKKNFFCGLPAPAGAIALLLPILFDNLNNQVVFHCYCVPLTYALFIAFLLISTFPMPSLKGFHFGIKSIKDILFTIGFMGICGYFLMYPVKCLFLISILYLIAIPFTLIKYKIGMAKLHKILKINAKNDIKNTANNTKKAPINKKQKQSIHNDSVAKQVASIKKQQSGAQETNKKIMTQKNNKTKSNKNKNDDI